MVHYALHIKLTHILAFILGPLSLTIFFSLVMLVLVTNCYVTVTSVSTHYNCSVTVHLIYTIENGSVPLKNGLIQHKSKKKIRQFTVKD